MITLTSLNSELGTLKRFLEYCARIEVVDESLPEKVVVPEVPTEADVDGRDSPRMMPYGS